jgi:iron complex transport system substrate-binding protein
MSLIRTTFPKVRGRGKKRARQRLVTGLLLALLGLCGVLSASAVSCSSGGAAKVSSAPTEAYSRAVITDDLERTFRFDSPPRRIVSLSPAYTETLFALGAGDRVVGVDDYSDYPPEAASRAKVGGGHHANLESIVALEPDLVVALVEEQEVDALAARGIPAIKLLPTDFEGVFHSILSLGKVTGTGPCAQEIVTDMKERIARVEARVKGRRPPRVFLELDGTDPARPFTSGPRSFIGAMLQTAGGSNIAHEIRTPSDQMSLEAIVAEDPEIIVLMDSRSPVNPQSREDVLNRRGWSGISAVRKGAVVSVDSALFSRPSPRLVEGIELLAHLLHPEAVP